jgi:hypothetical protein
MKINVAYFHVNKIKVYQIVRLFRKPTFVLLKHFFDVINILIYDINFNVFYEVKYFSENNQ